MRLLCAIDESTTSRFASLVAAQLAQRLRAELTCVGIDAAAGASGAATALTARAAAGGFDLIVVGHVPRGRAAAVATRETHDLLVAAAPCPVMIVPIGATLPTVDRLLLGYDLSPASLPAAAVAGRLASRLGSSVALLHVVEEQRASHRHTGWERYAAGRDVAQVAQESAGGSLQVEATERQGSPTPELVRALTDLPAALAVVGTRPRPRWRRRVGGSVAMDLAREAPRPVVVVPAKMGI